MPFGVTGLDFTGAIKYRAQSRVQAKAYVLLYSCSLTRAVHLDLMQNMELLYITVQYFVFNSNSFLKLDYNYTIFISNQGWKLTQLLRK